MSEPVVLDHIVGIDHHSTSNLDPVEWEGLPEAEKQRLRVLRDLDNRPFGWFHIKTMVVSGVGFYTDQYDIFSINLVVPMLGYIYWASNSNKVPTLDSTLMKGSATIGTFIGQLLFGFLGDHLGRKRIYGLELAIIIFATVCCSISDWTPGGVSITVCISLWRFLLGIGIGGDYPLSAVLTSEFSSRNKRGMMIALVFAMQGIGILSAAIVSVILLQIFKVLIQQDQVHIDHVWRILILVGVIPAACALYSRTRVPESPRYTLDVSQSAAKAAQDMLKTKSKDELERDASATHVIASSAAALASTEGPKEQKKLTWTEFWEYARQWKNAKVLIGAALSWFLLDVAFYGLNLNTSIVLTAIGFSSSKSKDPFKALWATCGGNALINVMGTVPGYFFTVAFVERWGRKKIQLMGFIILTIIFVILSAAYVPLTEHHKWLFVLLYCLGQFFQNFGPNATTFIIPGEIFPTRMRSTGHGICAATGKLGAILAAYGFQPIVDNAKTYNGIQVVMAIFSGVMFLGIFTTLMVPETKGLSLEELSDNTMAKLKSSPAVSPSITPSQSPSVMPQIGRQSDVEGLSQLDD